MFIKNPLIQTLHVSWLKEKCSIIKVILSDLAVVNTLRKTTQISLFSKINSFHNTNVL